LRRKYSWEEGYEEESWGQEVEKQLGKTLHSLNGESKAPEPGKTPAAVTTPISPTAERRRPRRKPVRGTSYTAELRSDSSVGSLDSDRSSVSSGSSNGRRDSETSFPLSSPPPPPQIETAQRPAPPVSRAQRRATMQTFVPYQDVAVQRPQQSPFMMHPNMPLQPRYGDPRGNVMTRPPLHPLETNNRRPPPPRQTSMPPKQQYPFKPNKRTSPVSPHSYTAMIDLRPPQRAPPPPPPPRTRLELPIPAQTKPLTIPAQTKPLTIPTKHIRFSLPNMMRDVKLSPGRYRKAPTPPEPSLPSPEVSPIPEPLTRSQPDSDYNGGYESDRDSIPEAKAKSPVEEQTPRYQPPPTPRSPRTSLLPRITTDLAPARELSPVRPLQPKHQSPVEVEIVTGDASPAENQSQELTEILDLYLDEIVADPERGDMSPALMEFLRSPTIMGEWDNIFDETPPVKGVNQGVTRVVSVKRKDGSWVSIIRRALSD